MSNPGGMMTKPSFLGRANGPVVAKGPALKIGPGQNAVTGAVGLNGRSPLVSRPESGVTGNEGGGLSSNPFGRGAIKPTFNPGIRQEPKKDTPVEDMKFTGAEKLKPNVDFSSINTAEGKKPVTKPKNTLQDWYDTPTTVSNKPDLNKPKLSESLAQGGNLNSRIAASKKDDFFDSGPEYGQSEKFKPTFLQNSRKFTPGPNAFVKRDPQVDLMSSIDIQPVSNPTPLTVYEDKYEDGFETPNQEVEIKFAEVQEPKRDKGLIDKRLYLQQKAKVAAVKSIIKFEIERMEVFELSTATIYESYLQGLTDGNIRNQGEQTNEDAKSASTQTDLAPPQSCGHQFPEVVGMEEEVGQNDRSGKPSMKKKIAISTTTATGDDDTDDEGMPKYVMDMDEVEGGRTLMANKLKDPLFVSKLSGFLDRAISMVQAVFQSQTQRGDGAVSDTIELPDDPLKAICQKAEHEADVIHLTDRSSVIVLLKVEYRLTQLIGSTLPVPYKKGPSLIAEYPSGSRAPVNLYISEEPLTQVCLQEEQGFLIAGDSGGALRLFQPGINKFKLGSDKTGRNIFKPCHIADAREERRHKGPICLISIGKEAVFSADECGRVIVWIINSAKPNSPEISPLNFIDLPSVGVSTLAYLDISQQIIVGTEGGSLLQLDSAISPSTPVTSRQSIDVSKAEVTSACMTSLEVLLAGYSNGSVRMFIELHRDSVFTLPPVSASEILCVFPATYPRVDKTTYKKIIMECLASLNVVDQQGKLYIYNLEEKMGPPEKVFDLIPLEDKGAKALRCHYDGERNLITLLYIRKDGKIRLSRFDLKPHKKAFKKIADLQAMNFKFTKLLKLSFVN